MTEEEEAAYYAANRHRLDEIFDGETVEFVVPENATTTTSIRLKRSELAEISRAADSRGMKLTAFIRESALSVARETPSSGLRDHEEAVRERLEALMADAQHLIAALESPSDDRHSGVRQTPRGERSPA